MFDNTVTAMRDLDNSVEGRRNRMVSDTSVHSILSQGQTHGMDFQIGASISSIPTILNLCEQHLTIPYGRHAVYNRNLISGFHVDRGNILYHSYLQQSDTQNVGDLELSVPIRQCHRYDDLQGNTLRRQLCERIISRLPRPLSLESQILIKLRQLAHMDTLRFSTVGHSILQQNTFSDLTLSRVSLDGSHSARNGKAHPFASSQF